ncbi:unnamed protein product [Caenorhabditis angaria]|uniref:Large ribosomal subunit protein mL50 n=1 Tax=Caenorhabditis angaria TaxID=860376 RepID=A0A9P1I982_9PELO|nr:unnamed protein product [Caenorhabditis angaria]
MYRTLPRFVRSQGNFLKTLFDKKPAAKNLTAEEQEKLRQTLPSIRAKESQHVAARSDFMDESDELEVSRFDEDAIRARGFLKYQQSYSPSENVGKLVESLAKDVDFSKNEQKFEFLVRVGEEIGHWPTNSKLAKFENIQDVVEFYETPVKNLTKYQELARDESKPQNISIIENAVRFHPEDTHLHHGGITAFPGTGGEVLSLRQKRILRQFQPKNEWFDYDDQTFDYTRPDKDMPWDAEVANQMDRYTDKRYNLKTKQFTRIRQ